MRSSKRFNQISSAETLTQQGQKTDPPEMMICNLSVFNIELTELKQNPSLNSVKNQGYLQGLF